MDSQCRLCCRQELLRKARGFTLVELIMVMVITGILAAFVAPRFFDNSVFQSRGFADQVQATLRFAQKTAIAQRHFVCVYSSANTVVLNIDTTPISSAHTVATCPAPPVTTSNMTSPSGGPYIITAPSNVAFSTTPASIYFGALGRPSIGTSGVVGTTTITVESETGYVHQ